MTNLYDPQAHVAVDAAPWCVEAAERAIARIGEETASALLPGRFWPINPEEDDDVPPDAAGLRGVYHGAAGVIGALRLLASEESGSPRLDLAALIDEVYDAYLASPLDTPAPEPSYLIGESGILFTAWRVSPTAEKERRLQALIASNHDNPAQELLWGAPGTLAVAGLMRHMSADPGWDQVARAAMSRVWESWERCPGTGCWLWTQDLYGHRRHYLGAAHGFAGNVRSLVAVWDLLSPEQRGQLVERSVITLSHHAVHDGELTNWWPKVGDGGAVLGAPRVQWCHGAPGIVTSFSPIPIGLSAELDALLVRAGELTWQAGPLAKASGLCHGTAGNGYAFLALYQRTGEPQWLARARHFAMAAIRQYEARRAGGPPWSALWTGDLGLAVYLLHCIDGQGGLPSLDTW
jgi:hypothetical protein